MKLKNLLTSILLVLFSTGCGKSNTQNNNVILPLQKIQDTGSESIDIHLPDPSKVNDINTTEEVKSVDNSPDSNNSNVPITIASIVPLPIFIIGDSTVDNHTKKDNKRVKMGWGNVIDELMVDPDMKYNHARSSTSSLSFVPYPTWSTNGFWGDGLTPSQWGDIGGKQEIIETDTSKGGFLLVQFGHNDAANRSNLDLKTITVPNINLQTIPNAPEDLKSFEDSLKKYINHAIANNVTPVLITPVSRMIPYDTTCPTNNIQYKDMSSCAAQHIYTVRDGFTNNPFSKQTLDYPKAMKLLYQEYIKQGKKIILLDLTKASMQQYRTIIAQGENKATTASVMARYAYDDFTHFNQKGARMVAGLIKELACEKDMNLCAQFK